MPPAAACVAARHASCGQQNHRRGATRGTIRRTCVCRFRFVIRPRSILCCNDVVVFPGRSRRGAGPRAAAGRGERSDHAGPAPRPTTAHGAGRLRTDHTTRTIPLPDVRAIARIRQRNLRGSHERPPARAPTLTRRPHDAIVIVRSAFTVFAPLPPPRPQFAIATARGTGRRVTYNAAPRAATPGEGSGVCHPCARVFIWNDSSAPEAE